MARSTFAPALQLQLIDDVERKREIAQRFWSRVERRAGDACWPWLAGASRWGTGRVRLDSSTELLASRLAWLLAFGSLPLGSRVLHRRGCNAACVRADHLRIAPMPRGLLPCTASKVLRRETARRVRARRRRARNAERERERRRRLREQAAEEVAA